MPEADTGAAPAGPRASIAGRVALSYAALASLWVLLSDRAIGWLIDDPEALGWAATGKAWLFVVVTAALLYGLLRRHPGWSTRNEPAPAAERRLAWGVGLAIAAATLAAGIVASNQQRIAAGDALTRTADLLAVQAAAWAHARLDDGMLVREFGAATR